MKVKSRHVSLFVALFMLFVSVAGIGGAVRVGAESVGDSYYEFPEPVPDDLYVADPDEYLTSLYYFSDYWGSEGYYNTGFVRKYINQNPNITYSRLYYCGDANRSDIPWRGNFWSMISYIGTDIYEIENAFVIFEIRKPFPTEVFKVGADIDPEVEQIYDTLNDLFSALKDNGCKIMFISGTDEACYMKNDKNAFLEHVDIQINLDYWTTYIFSIFALCEDAEHIYQDNSVFIMDQGYRLCDDVYRWLIRYLVFQLEGGYAINTLDEGEMLDFTHTTAFYYHDGAFSHVYNNSAVTEGEYSEKLSGASHVCVIGNPSINFTEDFNTILENYCGGKYTYCTYAPFTSSEIDYYLTYIMRDFILNDVDSLNKYYNRYSQYCAVTFQPLFVSEDGWLRYPEQRTWLDRISQLPEFDCTDADLEEFVCKYWGVDNVWGIQS